MRWALVVVIAACGSDRVEVVTGDTKAVDLEADQRATYCDGVVIRPLLGCNPAPGQCYQFRLAGSCLELLQALPASCRATLDEVLACFNATCNGGNATCSDICGVTFWKAAGGGCG